MGVSPRRFFGWEPAEYTTLLRDDSGEITGWVTTREPEFSDADRAMLLASKAASEEPKSRTGFPLDEATDPALQHQWTVPLPTTDFAQAALDRAQDAYQKRKDAGEVLPDPGSLLWRVERLGAVGDDKPDSGAGK